MEPHNFLENLDNKEKNNTLRMPIKQQQQPIQKIISKAEKQEDDNNKNKINNNKNDIHFIKSTEYRLPSFLQDISYDDEKNR